MQIITTQSTNASILYQKAEAVATPLDQETIEQIETMRAFFKTFEDKSGFAAPQVGISKRIVLIERICVDGLPSKEPVIFINPTWTPIDNETALDFEGCLSVPNKKGIVERFRNIQFNALQYNPTTQTLTPTAQAYHSAFASVLWQHEIDHLDGQIYADKAILMLTNEEADLIQQHMILSGSLLPGATIFDLGQAMQPIAQAYKKQLQPLKTFLNSLQP